MHRVFVTEGLVLSKRSVGESNTLVALFTQELGLVRGSARSARKEVSKLRFGLEPLTTARYSMVRGRHEWKLTGVERVSRELQFSTSHRAQMGRIMRLLLRLIHGEEPVPGLYEEVVGGLSCLSHTATPAEAQSVEYVLVLRILDHLGYLPDSPELTVFLSGDLALPERTAQVQAVRPLLIRTINESLNATGL